MLNGVAGRPAIVPVHAFVDVSSPPHIVTIRVTLAAQNVNESLSDTPHVGTVGRDRAIRCVTEIAWDWIRNGGKYADFSQDARYDDRRKCDDSEKKSAFAGFASYGETSFAPP